jgi:hypothetical protein
MKTPSVKQQRGPGMNLGLKKPRFGTAAPKKPQPKKPTILDPLQSSALRGEKTPKQNTYLPPLAGSGKSKPRKPTF